MLIAGIGWGVYSLQGRKSVDALANTAGNFLRASPIALVVWLGFAQGPIGVNGAMFAIASGALASGLGYAIWYAALPWLDASLAVVAPIRPIKSGAADAGQNFDRRYLSAIVDSGALPYMPGKRATSRVERANKCPA